jgi:dienelactone hydrolase
MKIIIGILISLTLLSVHAAGMPVNYQINGADYEGYYVSASPDAPLILLVHDWDGLTDYEVERAEMLAEMGYSVFAADLFGAGERPTRLDDKRQHTGELYKNRKKMRSLMTGALEKAISLGGNSSNAVAMGYCFGGAAVLELARSGADLKGFATFHGGLKTPEGQNYSETKGRVLIMHGSADTAITMEHFAGLANDLEKSDVPHEMITYSGAPHAFTVFGTDRYREDADRKSWERFSQFLDQVVELPVAPIIKPVEPAVEPVVEQPIHPAVDSNADSLPQTTN